MEEEVVKIRKDGRITIPKSAREREGIKVGDYVSISVTKVRMELEKKLGEKEKSQ